MAEPIVGVLLRLARQQGVSGMPHLTTSCTLGKLAILSGHIRLTFAEPQATTSRTAAGLFTAGKQ